MIIDCKSIAQDIKNKIKNIIAEANDAPVLYIYQVGDNPASNAYIRGKLRDCEEVGIEAELIKLPENITEDELNNKILEDYNWEYVDGIIVQLRCQNILILRISLFQTNLTLMVLILHHHFSLALRLAL